MLRFFFLLVSSLAAFACEETIISFGTQEGAPAVNCASGRVFRFIDDPVVRQEISQMREGEILDVEGKGVVVVCRSGGETLLFADEGSRSPGRVEAVELFAIPRTGSRILLSLLRHNLPETAVRVRHFPYERLADLVDSVGSIKEARNRLLAGAAIEPKLPDSTLVVIGVRAPRAHLESLYRVSALPFKEDLERGFSLFLDGGARLPSRINTKDPLTGERSTNPLQVRRMWLFKALFVERLAQKSVVIDFEQLLDNPAAIMARICASYGCAHAPYFKAAQLDSSGKGPYRRPKMLPLSPSQEMKWKLLSDEKLEKHFGFDL